MTAKISVERLLEQEVDEINRNGEEKYIKPFSLSEQLTHFAGKIDFYEGIDNVQVTEEEEEEEEEEEKVKDKDSKDEKNSEQKWHWEGVHSKLRTALSETCVMLDVFQNLNKKKYLVLDPIQQTSAPEKQTIQMLEKRKYLARAGSIIGKGAMAMQQKKRDESEPIVVEENENEYYMQLMKLRQYWRVKKVGTQITGDVSYRSAGSKFWHPGLFEVKADHNNDSETKTLAINVSPDLSTHSKITISVYDENERHQWSEISYFEPNFFNNQWASQLRIAQHHLFNKELFANLSNDAFQGSFNGVEVLDYQISCKVFDDAKVIISHNVSEVDDIKKEKETMAGHSKTDLNFLLNQLLLKQHKLASKRHVPYPSTSNYYQKQSRSSTVFNLLNRDKPRLRDSILHKFIEQAKLKIWERRLKYYFDQQNSNGQGPYITTHWNHSSTKDHASTLIVSIVSKLKSSTITRTSFFISICGSGDLVLIFDDGKRIELPCSIDSLDLLVKCKIQYHMLTVVKTLCLLYSWSVINCTSLKFPLLAKNSIGFPDCKIVVRNLKNRHSLFFDLGDIAHVEVELSTETVPDFVGSEFSVISTSCKKIAWHTVAGHTFVEKLQTLFLCC